MLNVFRYARGKQPTFPTLGISDTEAFIPSTTEAAQNGVHLVDPVHLLPVKVGPDGVPVTDVVGQVFPDSRV